MIDKSKEYAKLYKHLAQEENKKSLDWKSTGRIFPSSSGINCELNLRYGFLGTDKKSDFTWYGCEFKIGDAIHEYIQNTFKQKFGKRVKVESWASYWVEDVKINAKIDLILDNKKIIELKTVKAAEGKEPKSKDIKQVQWYMGVLKLDKAVLSYFNRENGVHISSFEIEFDQIAFDAIRNKFARVINGAKDLRSDTRECKFCSYSWKCPEAKYYPKWGK